MPKRLQSGIYISFMILFGIILWQSFFIKTQWTYDILFFGTIYSILFFFRIWFKIKSVELLLAGIGFSLHLLGFYGLYGWHYNLFGYDSLTHIIAAFAVAWICFNFLIQKFYFKKKKGVEHFVGEHRVLFFILVISVVSLLGVLIEIMEFLGYTFFDFGEGMFFAGSGDEDIIANLPTGYADTMMDIITNILGAFLGAVAFYVFRYPKKRIAQK